MIIFNNTSAEIKTKSADVLLKMIIVLKELRIAKLCSWNEQTLEHYGKRIKILNGRPFEGWSNRAWPSHPFWQKSADWLNWPCPVGSAIKRIPLQDFNSFSIMFYYIISTTYQKIGDLFCPVVFLDFRTVCSASIFSLLQKSLKARECQLKKHFHQIFPFFLVSLVTW